MQRQFLLLWALCALATALPQDKKPVETESEDPKKWDSNRTNKFLDLLSPSPTNSSLLNFTNSPDTNTPLNTTTLSTTTTTSTTALSSLITPTTPPDTNTPFNTTPTTTSSTTYPSLTPTTSATTSTTVATSTTAKPKSKVINIQHADNLTTTMSKAGDKLVVIFVMTTWCSFSVRVMPTVEEVARSTENIIVCKVVFNRIDTSEDWKYGVTDVSGFPTFIFFKNGTKLEEYYSGDAKRLKERVTENMIRSI